MEHLLIPYGWRDEVLKLVYPTFLGKPAKQKKIKKFNKGQVGSVKYFKKKMYKCEANILIHHSSKIWFLALIFRLFTEA